MTTTHRSGTEHYTPGRSSPMRKIIIAAALLGAGIAVTLGLPADAAPQLIKYAAIRW